VNNNDRLNKQLDEFRESLKRQAKSSFEGISNSAIFLSVLTENVLEDPVPCLEFGMAVLLDKPIYLIVQRGMPVPKNVQTLAKAIEFYDKDNQDSIAAAADALVEKFMLHQTQH